MLQAGTLPIRGNRSVRAQTHPYIETLVVDDGSPDNTAEITAQYPSVRYMRQKNKGRSQARNAGFAAACGDYIVFLDADDRLLPDAVKAHLRCFASNPEAGFVVGAIDQIASDGSYIYSPRWPVLRAGFYEELLKVNHLANTIGVMFRRTTFQAAGGFASIFEPAEDYEILLRTSRSFVSAHHRTVVAQYRRHSSNTSRQGARMLRATHRVMCDQRHHVKGGPELEAALRRGSVYWREHYGLVTIREIYEHLFRKHLLLATHSAVILLCYVRIRLLLLPWKYRARLVNALRKAYVRSA